MTQAAKRQRGKAGVSFNAPQASLGHPSTLQAKNGDRSTSQMLVTPFPFRTIPRGITGAGGRRMSGVLSISRASSQNGVQTPGKEGSAAPAGGRLTCREVGLGVDRRGGGQERCVSHKERAERALRQERGALLRRNVLAAAHAAVNLEVQGFAFLLGSERETEAEERATCP